MKQNNKLVSGLGWKLLERFGVQGVSFVVSLVLSRLLDPAHYGTLSMMTIFTYLAQVFIQNGFNTALVQKKDATEEDYSSVFWVTMGITAVLYGVLYFCAPAIGAFYAMPDLAKPLRVLALMLFPGTLNSIQIAIISRKMDFKQVFRSSVVGIVLAGGIGIVLAYKGAGIWALVAQNLVNVTTTCVVMCFTVHWRPRFVCNMTRVKILFSYGWKMLLSGLLDTLYNDLYSLVIGKKYDAGTLGYYNRGKQFPQFVIDGINGAVQSVLLPAMSAEQDDREKVKLLTRNSVMLSSYILFPMMAGLAGVATPLIRLLLTEKWLPCVPYMQICCFTFAFYPVHTSNLQAIKAMGRSDIFLKLEIVKKVVNLSILAVAVFCFDSPIAIALSGLVSLPIGIFINAFPNKKLINYSYFEQIKDILPSFIAAIVMCGGVFAVELLRLNDLATLILQVVVGVVLYIAISAVVQLEPFKTLLGMIKEILKKTK